MKGSRTNARRGTRKTRRPSAPLVMGIFSGSVAALAVLPVALLLVAWDTNAALGLAGEKAIIIAELRASSDGFRSDRVFERFNVATMLRVSPSGEQIVERGAALSGIPLAEGPFAQLCARPGTYDLISLEGRQWAWSCSTQDETRHLVGIKPVRISLGFVIFLLFIVIAVVGLVTAFVVLRVLAPMSRVSTALTRVQAGERNVRVQATGLAELDALVFTLNDAALAMEQREDTIMARIRVAQRMARMVAHEVRNPLQSIELLTSLMVEEPDESARRETGQSIRQEIRDLDRVVTQMLRRSVGDDLTIQARPAALLELVRHVVELHTATAAERGVALNIGDIDPRSIAIDSALVGRSLENLVQNALHYAHSQVKVSARANAGGIDILVDDDGDGVDPSIADRVFAANTSLREGGTGLGLALVAAVAGAHNGYSIHEKSPMGGARFILHLPATATITPDDRATPSPPHSATPGNNPDV